jgi:flagellar hook protein FlgE
MLSSLFSGISGLLASSNAINVVGNNIANVNTTGYKSSSCTFEDALYQSINSSSGASQVGRGVQLSSVTTDFSEGSLETTSSSTDLAIGGKGFFIVRDSSSGHTYYTRAGSFFLNSNGNLVDPNGYVLQGKEIDQATGAAAGVDRNITISQAPSQPRATQYLAMNVNLQSDSQWAGAMEGLSGTGAVASVTASDGEYPATGSYVFAYNAATGELTVTVSITDLDGNVTGTQSYTNSVAAGTSYTNFGGSGLDIVTVGTPSFPSADTMQTTEVSGFSVTEVSATQTPSTTSNYSSSITVYDSLGQSHTVTVYFRKSSEYETTGQSTWEWIAEVDATDSTSGVNTIAGWGTLTFNSKGVLVSGGEAQAVSFNFSNGAEQNQNIDLVFGSGTGGGTTTQYTIASTTNYQTQDGYPPGTLESVTVSSDGIISGTYSNGQTIELYQITLANFNNPNGLKKEGSNLYSATVKSGVAYTASPGNGGLGTISSNSLEESNVDLATEFVKLIVAQRAYQANSKVITTTDEILEILMNIKR